MSKCSKCNHNHAFKDVCGVILDGNEEEGIIYAECSCDE